MQRGETRQLPRLWRAHQRRDPEKELLRLNRRLRGVSRRIERRNFLRRLYRWAKLAVLALISSAGLYAAVLAFSPWPPLTLLKHVVASHNCDAAHEVGLAPARVGEPGYWEKNDRDRDGIACEAYPSL